MEMGLMTGAQISNVLHAQKAGDKSMFGVIAIKLGYITERDLEGYMAHIESEYRRIDGAVPGI